MKLTEMLARAFTRPVKDPETGEIILCNGAKETELRLGYKTLALNACIDFLANALIACDFQTFVAGQTCKDDLYYRLNIEPNASESAARFWKRVLARLFMSNECAIWLDQKQFYVLDSYEYDRKTAKFSKVKINDNAVRTLGEKEVIFLEWRNSKIASYVEDIYSDVGALIGAVTNSTIKHQYAKLLVEIPMNYPQTPQAQEDLNKLVNVNLKKLVSNSANTVATITNGLKVSRFDLGGAGGSASINDLNARSLVNDYVDYIALAAGIPPVLLHGEVADTKQAVVNFVTFCLDPLTRIIAQEFNRKYFSIDEFKKKNFIRIDTSRIQLGGVDAQADAINVLLRSGVLSIDDSLIMMGREPIGADWSTTHWITKNYATVENAMLDTDTRSQKGGIDESED